MLFNAIIHVKPHQFLHILFIIKFFIIFYKIFYFIIILLYRRCMAVVSSCREVCGSVQDYERNSYLILILLLKIINKLHINYSEL